MDGAFYPATVYNRNMAHTSEVQQQNVKQNKAIVKLKIQRQAGRKKHVLIFFLRAQDKTDG